jgi:CBS domain-containing protein
MSQQTIRDVARLDAVTCRPDADALELARRMREEDIGSVVVVSDNHPIGIVTDRDLALQVVADGVDEQREYARELMSVLPATIRDELGVAAAAREMDTHGVRRLPVVDKGDQLVGIVSLDDIYRELVREHEHLAEVMAAEAPD